MYLSPKVSDKSEFLTRENSIPVRKSFNFLILKKNAPSTLYKGVVDAGTYEANWNGLDQSGNQVPSGVYVYQIVSENYSQSKRMTLVK